MLAVLVVFTSVVESRIIAMYVGGIPVAEHDNLEPTGTMGDNNRKTTLGKTKNDLHLLTLNSAPILNSHVVMHLKKKLTYHR